MGMGQGAGPIEIGGGAFGFSHVNGSINGTCTSTAAAASSTSLMLCGGLMMAGGFWNCCCSPDRTLKERFVAGVTGVMGVGCFIGGLCVAGFLTSDSCINTNGTTNGTNTTSS